MTYSRSDGAIMFLLVACFALTGLAGCKPDYQRKQIGGKGKTIQLTWEEEQFRRSNRGIDRDGNPPSLTDCEERAWKNRRALGLEPSEVKRVEEAGDTYRFVGQYAFRKRAGYGGAMSQPDQNWLMYAVLPDFSPQYHDDRKLCSDSKVLRDANGNSIDGTTCRRYDVVKGVANLAAITMQCLEVDSLSRRTGEYWPLHLPSRKEDAFMAYGEVLLTGKPRNLVDWTKLQRNLRSDLGMWEYTGHVWTDRNGTPLDNANVVFYEPVEEYRAWHLGQPTIFQCPVHYEKSVADTQMSLCTGPATPGSWVAPGFVAGMTFPIKFLPQWRELTKGFAELVTSYQTTDQQAPPPFAANSVRRPER